MLIWVMFKMAVRSLMTHKLRTFLTALGIIIGVASVISMIRPGMPRHMIYPPLFSVWYLASATAICPSARPPSLAGTSACWRTVSPAPSSRSASIALNSRFWNTPPERKIVSQPVSVERRVTTSAHIRAQPA